MAQRLDSDDTPSYSNNKAQEMIKKTAQADILDLSLALYRNSGQISELPLAR